VNETAGLGGAGEGDTLPDPAHEHRRIVIGERSGGFAAKDGARSAAIEDEAGDDRAGKCALR
jgi:hypothetical protein